MRPLFEVGEEVVLVSEYRPDLNGDCMVVGIINEGDAFSCPHCGSIWKLSVKEVTHAYFLSTKEESNCCSPWCESSLRKKHKPSDFSFDDMMSEIKSIDGVEVQ